MQRQSGFTLIELVVVIVILGILAAAAVPRFIDLEDEAAHASVEALAGNLGSASAMNYAACKVKNNTSNDCTTGITQCTDVKKLVDGETLNNYTIVQLDTLDNGYNCTVKYDENNSINATFHLHNATS